ncbi:MAG: glucose-6-phosphate isomerase [candidate division Zixibacteria bacterium]|nr:glucose-6-phosphate isomerase [candidate division Zixibacteria bacterium]
MEKGNIFDLGKLKGNQTVLRQIQSSVTKGNFEPGSSFIEENSIGLNLTHIVSPVGEKTFISKDELNELSPRVIDKFRLMRQTEGDCYDGDTSMLGWQSFPEEINREYLDDITSAAKELANKIDAYVSLGIGGSYLGIEATFKALTHTYFNQLPREKRGGMPQIYFLGQNTDPDFFRDTLDMLDGKRIGINVISKSGTTAETAIAFRIIRNILESAGSRDSREFIFATTDAVKGALRKLSEQKGFRAFVVPDNIGGRFSVLSDVGLVGLAMAGIDIYEFVAGFRHMKKRVEAEDYWTNPSMLHAAVRHLAYEKGKKIEVVATNSAAIYQLTRWMEQLFPESEGHNGYGMWVSPSLYSEKLHANGQMVQQGERNIIETFLKLENSDNMLEIPADPDNLDRLNYLSDNKRDMNFINSKVIEGPAYAHFMGGVPNMTISIPRRNAFNIGQFYYMMELSVALSGYLAGHNPFIQPGVEAYKKAMFAMLGKPGTEDDKKAMSDAGNRLNRFVI